MRMKFVGNKRDNIILTYMNCEASASIPVGAPVMHNMSATAAASTDGVCGVLPSTAGAALYQFLIGVNVSTNLAVNQYGEALAYGYCPSTLVKLRTRATSTDTWASVATVASALLLVPDFTNNDFQTLANVAAQSTPPMILLDTLASMATQASTYLGTAIVENALKRSFVRIL
jgi:hypothetical protein